MPDENDYELTFNVTQERLGGLSWGTIRNVNKDPEAMSAYLARFMWDDEAGRYLTEDEAYEILDELSVDQIREAVAQLEALSGEVAVPN